MEQRRILGTSGALVSALTLSNLHGSSSGKLDYLATKKLSFLEGKQISRTPSNSRAVDAMTEFSPVVREKTHSFHADRAIGPVSLCRYRNRTLAEKI
jgi:hypothetical protein